MTIDDIDRMILVRLQGDGRETASQIAKELKLTVPTITERIRKLQDAHIIQAFQAVINPGSLGLDVTAIITIISSSSDDHKKSSEGNPRDNPNFLYYRYGFADAMGRNGKFTNARRIIAQNSKLAQCDTHRNSSYIIYLQDYSPVTYIK